MFQVTVWQTKRMYHYAMEVRFSCTPQPSSTSMSKDKMPEVFPLTWISFFKKVLLMCWGSPSQAPSLPSWLSARLGLLLQLSAVQTPTTGRFRVQLWATRKQKDANPNCHSPQVWYGNLKMLAMLQNSSQKSEEVVDPCFQKTLLIRFTEVLSHVTSNSKSPLGTFLGIWFLGLLQVKRAVTNLSITLLSKRTFIVTYPSTSIIHLDF